MCENMTPSITPEVCDLSPSEKNRATAMGSMQTKFGDVRTSGFRDMLLDRQSDTLVRILRSPTGGGLLRQHPLSHT